MQGHFPHHQLFTTCSCSYMKLGTCPVVAPSAVPSTKTFTQQEPPCAAFVSVTAAAECLLETTTAACHLQLYSKTGTLQQRE